MIGLLLCVAYLFVLALCKAAQRGEDQGERERAEFQAMREWEAKHNGGGK